MYVHRQVTACCFKGSDESLRLLGFFSKLGVINARTSLRDLGSNSKHESGKCWRTPVLTALWG